MSRTSGLSHHANNTTSLLDKVKASIDRESVQLRLFSKMKHPVIILEPSVLPEEFECTCFMPDLARCKARRHHDNLDEVRYVSLNFQRDPSIQGDVESNAVVEMVQLLPIADRAHRRLDVTNIQQSRDT